MGVNLPVADTHASLFNGYGFFFSLFTSCVPLPAFQTQLLQGEESVHAFMQWALFKMAWVK